MTNSICPLTDDLRIAYHRQFGSDGFRRIPTNECGLLEIRDSFSLPQRKLTEFNSCAASPDGLIHPTDVFVQLPLDNILKFSPAVFAETHRCQSSHKTRISEQSRPKEASMLSSVRFQRQNCQQSVSLIAVPETPSALIHQCGLTMSPSLREAGDNEGI